MGGGGLVRLRDRMFCGGPNSNEPTNTRAAKAPCGTSRPDQYHFFACVPRQGGSNAAPCAGFCESLKSAKSPASKGWHDPRKPICTGQRAEHIIAVARGAHLSLLARRFSDAHARVWARVAGDEKNRRSETTYVAGLRDAVPDPVSWSERTARVVETVYKKAVPRVKRDGEVV